LSGRRYASDDDLRSVSEVFLGPKGYTLPFKARYRAYGAGCVVFLLAVTVLHHFLSGLTMLIWSLAVTVLLTYALMRTVTVDVTVRSKVGSFFAELRAPRPAKTETGRYGWPKILG
jgi:hypothetical protein